MSPSTEQPFSYDVVPYPSYAYSQTHPDHLATLATLSGMTPAPPATCRVLELGCAAGGNIIPIACSLPHSRCTGIDLSGPAIAKGQAEIAELGLDNVRLMHLDILDIGDDIGSFDYIIVYGIYSWVSPEIRDKIMGLCRRLLQPQGVAYLSYNVFPGWRMNGIIRDMLLYHTRNIDDPQEKIKQARAWLEYAAETVRTEHNPYGQFLAQMQPYLSQKSDAYLFHDYMETDNDPVYFHQFIERAEHHGLQYLANAEMAKPGTLPPGVSEHLLDMTGDIIQVEQYLDFLTKRAFRETLLCHQEISPNRTLRASSLDNLYLASRLTATNAPLDIHTTERDEFQTPGGDKISSAHPLTKAAFVYLAQQWPRPVAFEELAVAAGQMLGQEVIAGEDLTILGINLLQAYSHNINLVELHAGIPAFTLEISSRPVASASARYQAKIGYPVTNLYHQRVSINEVTATLLTHLDGQHDHAALLGVLLELEANDVMEVKLDGVLIDEPALIRQTLVQELERLLLQVANARLLVA